MLATRTQLTTSCLAHIRYTARVTIRLGPFELLQPVGKGGMGVVWRGQHVDTGVQVAVKVITQRVSRDDRTLAAFKNEVRAVAGLQHPGVVWVVDYGEVDAEASTASEGQLVTGSPYLVMEMASGGTLATHQDGTPWPQLRSVLMSMLDALAHAHARGVIHRDLKPGNILICGPDDLRPGLKLTDFGIAHAREETVSHSMSNHVIGTLHYMAPEQIRADWRDYGPWTDLYALGTIAYRMACGSLPFKGKRGASLMVAQMNHRPPPLDPVHPVPEGFEDWLLTMMRKEHWRRFQCAADAALALQGLPDPVAGRPLAPAPLGLEPLPMGVHDLLDEHPTTLVLEATLEIPDSIEPTAELIPAGVLENTSVAAARQRGELDRVRPSLPEHWARGDSLPVEQLRGAGLGLWGLRSIPVVGRVPERDALWRALHDVVRSRQARLVIVKGSKGVGKSALVQWLCERAAEIGAAHRFHCVYGPDEGLDEGLRRTLRTFFRVARLDDEQRRQRVLDVCDTFGETDANQAARVEKLLDPVDPDVTDGGGRHAAARWLMARVASDRPLVFWVDDAHHALDALKLVGTILKAQKTSPTRMLAVLTVDEGALGDRPLEASFLASLESHEATTVIQVPPLTDIEMYELAHAHLGLEPKLAKQVTEGAGGIPQFAVQVVGDWVEKGLLRRSSVGLVLPAGQVVPETIQEVWQERVEQILQAVEPGAGALLERAAALGMEVSGREWLQVCDPVEHDPTWRAPLLDRLLSMNLATEKEGGFAFVHEELRKTLLERAAQQGRLAGHHRAIAAMLADQEGAAAERLGMHLLAAGEVNAAIDALLGGIRSRVASVGPRAALPLLELLNQTLTEAGVPQTDSAWGRLWLVQADLELQRGRLEPALTWARKAERAADSHGWAGLASMAVFTQAQVALFRNEVEPAERLFAAFEEGAVPAANSLHRAAARHARSLLTSDRTAKSHAVACTEWLQNTGFSLVDVWRVLGTRTLLSVRAAGLVEHLHALGPIYEVDGQREGLGEAWTMLAGAMRRAKRTEDAELALGEALRVYRAAGSDEAQRAQLQLSILKLGRGEVDAAEALAAEVVTEVEGQRNRKAVSLRAHAALAACRAATERWREVGAHLDATSALVTETALVEREVAWCLARAGESARRAGERSTAIQAWELAWEQYRGLGDEGQARRLHTLITRSSA